MKASTATRALAVLAILVSILAIQALAPPAPKPASAPPAEFSAARAREVVAEIAVKPHPVGSAEHDRVRDVLLRRLTELGLEPQIQRTIARSRNPRGFAVAGEVENLMVRLPGTAPGKAALLMAHYDSVPSGPGAADDGAGVAALLETLRALKTAPPLKNDLIFLLTDAEETPLLGAQAFVDEHPWMADVAVVLNFEARGSYGPSLMFETGPGNGRLIAVLARAVGLPMASSYSTEIYRRMPNPTDFIPFKSRGLPGLNFAFIHHATAYHTAQDSLARLDLGSLQHHGESALGLARALGQEDLGQLASGGDAVYFNLPGGIFLHYPGTWVLPFTILLALGTALALARGVRLGRLGRARLLIGALVCYVATGLVAFLVTVLSRLALGQPYVFTLWGGRTSLSLAVLALVLVAVGLAVVTFRRGNAALGGDNLMAGGLVMWLLMTIVVSLRAPGASALFALPLALALGATTLWWRVEPEKPIPWALFCAAAATVVVAALLWAPLLALVAVALEGGAAPVVGGGLVLVLFGVLGTVIALGPARQGGGRFALLALALGVGLLLTVRLSSHFGVENRRPSSLFYLLDHDDASARWMSFEAEPDAWTRPVFGANPEKKPMPAYLGDTQPVLTVAAPKISRPGASVHAERAAEGPLRVAFSWTERPARLLIRLHADPPVKALRLEGRPLEARVRTGDQVLIFFAPPAGGFELEVDTDAAKPLEIGVLTQYFGLPEGAGGPAGERPSDLMPLSQWINDSTLIHATTHVPAGPVPAATGPMPAGDVPSL